MTVSHPWSPVSQTLTSFPPLPLLPPPPTSFYAQSPFCLFNPPLQQQRLVNVVKPGTIPRFSEKPANHAKMIDNVSLFLRVARGWGMKEFELFSSNDLVELKNVRSVCSGIHALGRLLQSGEFENLDLPKLGNKVMEKNVRGLACPCQRWTPPRVFVYLVILLPLLPYPPLFFLSLSTPPPRCANSRRSS